MRQILTDRTRQEQNHHHRRRDPKRPVQIRIAIQHVQEICAREQSRARTAQHLGSVDVEELGVELNGPQVAFRRRRGCGSGRGCGCETVVSAVDVVGSGEARV